MTISAEPGYRIVWDDFQDRARRRVVLLQQRDPETIALWQALVAVSAHPQMVGTAQEREFHVAGELLTLTGGAVIGARPLIRTLRWERVAHRDRAHRGGGRAA